MMTKKDYVMLARVLATRRAAYCDSAQVAIVDDVIRAIASELLNTNQRFDMNKFCTAAMKAPTKV